MSEENSTPVQEKPKKKKRHLWWLNLLLTLAVFAGGVVLGLKLPSMPKPYELVGRYFPQLAVQTETVKAEPAVTVAPNPTPAPVSSAPAPTAAQPAATPVPTESPKSTPAPTEAPKPTPTPAPTEKPAEPEEQKPEAEPETTPEPADEDTAETVAAAGGFDSPTGILTGHTNTETKPSGEDKTDSIGLDAALEAALAHAKADESEVEIYGIYKSVDVDTVVYKVEFSVKGTEYTYMINASTGAVEGWQKLRTSQSVEVDEPSVQNVDEAETETVRPEVNNSGIKGPGGKK